MKRTPLVSTLVFASSLLLSASNAVPLIYQPTMPASVAPGHATFALQIRGTGFVSGAVVRWNGNALKTQVLSSSLLQAQVPAQVVAHAGTASVTVANPGTIASNVVYLSVRDASPTIKLKNDQANVEPGFLVVGDFNNDSRPDLAVAGQSQTQFVDMYLNGGRGKFKKIPGPQFFVTLLIGGNNVGDFNNDGNLDTTVCSSDGGVAAGCQVFLGDGRGGLTPGQNVASSNTLADMNGDGILDLVSTTFDGYFSYVTIQPGNGDGTFQIGTSTILGPSSTIDAYGAALVGDFNGDGKLDVVLPCMGHLIPGPGSLAVLLGNGDGTLQSETDYATPWGGTQGAIADVNNDGKLDVISSGFSVMLGNGDGTFTPGYSAELQSTNGNVVVGDFNGDSRLDIASIGFDFSTGDTTLNVVLGKGDGTFRAPIPFGLLHGSSTGLLNADFNNDGMMDFAFGGIGKTMVLVQAP
ncbi:MAG TPA: VCBS repeat-containing protein [Terriglobales bacterium]|nr:VCBS repeat-containing protein [Terriglobales bacterium]